MSLNKHTAKYIHVSWGGLFSIIYVVAIGTNIVAVSKVLTQLKHIGWEAQFIGILATLSIFTIFFVPPRIMEYMDG